MSALDMAAYLLSRIAEDERVAREAAVGRGAVWTQGDDDATGWDRDLVHFHSDRSGWTQFSDEAGAAHVSRWDPSRVLAECEAKRWIVERCQWVRDNRDYADWATADMADEVLQHLVQVYADRPDFPSMWPPEWTR